MAKPAEPLPPEVLAAFQRGEPIGAIKLLIAERARAASASKASVKPSTQAPAKTKPVSSASSSKAFTAATVQSIAEGRALSPGEVPRSSSTFWAWAVVALFVYLAFRLALG